MFTGWLSDVALCTCLENSAFRSAVFEASGFCDPAAFFGLEEVPFFAGWVRRVARPDALAGCFVGEPLFKGLGEEAGIRVLVGELGEESRKFERVFCRW